MVRIARPSSRKARHGRFLREWLPSRRSSVTDDIRFSRIEIAVRSRSGQWASIRSQSTASSPNSESMCW